MKKAKLMWLVVNEDGSIHVGMPTRKLAREWCGSHQRVVRVSVQVVGKG